MKTALHKILISILLLFGSNSLFSQIIDYSYGWEANIGQSYYLGELSESAPGLKASLSYKSFFSFMGQKTAFQLEIEGYFQSYSFTYGAEELSSVLLKRDESGDNYFDKRGKSYSIVPFSEKNSGNIWGGVFNVRIFPFQLFDYHKDFEFQPYLKIGAGLGMPFLYNESGESIDEVLKYTDSDSTWSGYVLDEKSSILLMLNIGLGAEYYFNKEFSVNLEFNYQMTNNAYLDNYHFVNNNNPSKADFTDAPADALYSIELGFTYYMNTEDDQDGDGLKDKFEKEIGTDPNKADTDGDGLNDAHEVNITGSDPLLADTDGDGLDDGIEYELGTIDIDTDDYDNDGVSDLVEYQKGSNLKNSDSDGDGLDDNEEINQYNTNPNSGDTEGDGYTDYVEVKNGLNPNEKQHLTAEASERFTTDSDGDLLPDSLELKLGSDILKPDSDGDGIKDYDEYKLKTNLTNPDSDDDGLMDGKEIEMKTDPLNPDSDGDGLIDGDEVNKHNTEPNNVDSDTDGLSDYEEILTYKTDPLEQDTDDDTFLDKLEIEEGTDPLDPESFPKCKGSRNDLDCDGLTNKEEEEIGSFIDNADSDGDGLSDYDEVRTYKTNPLMIDSDKDGLTDKEELLNPTYKKFKLNPNIADMDEDGLLDGDEIKNYNTNPNKEDTDEDELLDGDEIEIYKTDPTKADSDDDKLVDAQEIEYGTNPNKPDTDEDGIWDYEEINKFDTDPKNKDTDNDNLSDGQEVYQATAFDNKTTDPNKADTDGGTLNDGAELERGLNPFDPTDDVVVITDSDGDGLSDKEEDKHGSDPNVADTDKDGICDGDEVYGKRGKYKVKTSPTNPDWDNDGVSDGEELIYNTNPTVNDTDGDGLTDSEELFKFGYNPLISDAAKKGKKISNNEKRKLEPATNNQVVWQTEDLFKFPKESRVARSEGKKYLFRNREHLSMASYDGRVFVALSTIEDNNNQWADITLSKLNSDKGELVNGKTKVFGNKNKDDFIKDMKISPKGDIIICGSSAGKLYVMKINQRLELESEFKFDQKGEFSSVVIDSKGDIILGGHINLSTKRGKKNIGNSSSKKNVNEAYGKSDMLLVKMNDDLSKIQWVNVMGSKDEDNIKSLCLDEEDNTYFTGIYNDKFNFGTKELDHNRKADIILGKIQKTGIKSWVETFGSKYEDHVYNIKYDKQNVILSLSMNLNNPEEIYSSHPMSDEIFTGNTGNGKSELLLLRYNIEERGNETPYTTTVLNNEQAEELQDEELFIDINNNGNIIAVGKPLINKQSETISMNSFTLDGFNIADSSKWDMKTPSVIRKKGVSQTKLMGVMIDKSNDDVYIYGYTYNSKIKNMVKSKKKAMFFTDKNNVFIMKLIKGRSLERKKVPICTILEE